MQLHDSCYHREKSKKKKRYIKRASAEFSWKEANRKHVRNTCEDMLV